MELKKNVYEWEKYMAFLQAVGEELQCTLAPVEQIICAVGKRKELQSFTPVAYFCSCLPFLPFPERWAQALNSYHTAPKGMKATLESFGQLFGMYQAQVQLEALKNLQESARLHWQQAKDYCSTHSKLYSTLGILGGLGAAILMM